MTHPAVSAGYKSGKCMSISLPRGPQKLKIYVFGRRNGILGKIARQLKKTCLCIVIDLYNETPVVIDKTGSI